MPEVQRLDKTYEGKRLRVEFFNGEIAEVKIIEVALPNKYDDTPESWGIVYDLISTNRPRTAPNGAAFWSELGTIKSCEVLGDAS
jgi:hypothetical protein